jgi:hypothetical protein
MKLNKNLYYKILSPEFPHFIDKYITLSLLQRLSGVGLLCGTDWTPLYHNNFFYSRLDHSIGVALIIWNFTHDRIQTIAGLLHDVSTPAFSHVTDFRKGDALTQESTETENGRMLRADAALAACLESDGITYDQVDDYHKYPIADNEVPGLSADRLEYMFPSGIIFDGSWNMAAVEETYRDIVVCRNENGFPELGFATEEIAVDYCRRCCSVGLVFQRNENKVALQLMAEILNSAVLCGVIKEKDCFVLSEKQLITRFESVAEDIGTRNSADYKHFLRCFRTFRTMTHIEHTSSPLTGYFCVSIAVKKRYINPLVVTQKKQPLPEAVRIDKVSTKAADFIHDFITFTDSCYGCVKYI